MGKKTEVLEMTAEELAEFIRTHEGDFVIRLIWEEGGGADDGAGGK